jgi:2-hydroxychromene-2-carboxylate isomerase
MSESSRVIVYTDYKSPYAFLAKDLAYGLERDLRVRVERRPYLLDLASRYGSARVDANGRVLEENRDPHQWRRVRYSYMDCRRQARKRGLVIRGTQKIWDSTLALAGMLCRSAPAIRCSAATTTWCSSAFGSVRWTSRTWL